MSTIGQYVLIGYLAGYFIGVLLCTIYYKRCEDTAYEDDIRTIFGLPIIWPLVLVAVLFYYLIAIPSTWMQGIFLNWLNSNVTK